MSINKKLADDYAIPNFTTAHLRKDMLLFLLTARGMGLVRAGLDGLGALLQRSCRNPTGDL